jgi:hypothetical protein
MIKFEHNMLVLNNAFSEADVDEINAFAEHVRNQERDRIMDIIYASEFGGYDVGYLISLIKGENK